MYSFIYKPVAGSVKFIYMFKCQIVYASKYARLERDFISVRRHTIIVWGVIFYWEENFVVLKRILLFWSQFCWFVEVVEYNCGDLNWSGFIGCNLLFWLLSYICLWRYNWLILVECLFGQDYISCCFVLRIYVNIGCFSLSCFLMLIRLCEVNIVGWMFVVYTVS